MDGGAVESAAVESDGAPPAAERVADRVVAVGSSAGGLLALQGLSRGLVPGQGTCVVVAQHMAPERPSQLVELIDRETQFGVMTAVDGLTLAPDTVIVAPPDHDVLVDARQVRMCAPEPGHGPSPSVDTLFGSVATHWGARGIGVVLSGTGSDGAHGLRAIKDAQGLTIAQSPETARFDSMPRAAIELAGAELVLDPEEIGPTLADLCDGWADPATAATPPPVSELSRVVGALRRATGQDFSGFKASTLTRQLHRRMALRRTAEVSDYLPLLSAEPGEARALMSNLLVTVTSFFRDPEAFTALRDRLAAYLADRDLPGPIRVWVPGCATGAEAFSVAMVVADLLGHPEVMADRFKILGTDLSETALAVARRGIYPPSAVEHVPPELADRYLIESPHGWQVASPLRDCAVFAHHALGEDPPFPRLDLVSCRNTLIYFTPELQARALESFTFSLVPGGLLFLGTSENPSSAAAGAFLPVDPPHGIFSRSAVPASLPWMTARLSTPWQPAPARPPVAAGVRLQDSAPQAHVELLDAIVRLVVGPALVLDEEHRLVEIIGEVGRFCRLPHGPVSGSAVSFLRPELANEARALLLLARPGSGPVMGHRVPVGDPPVGVHLKATALDGLGRAGTILSFITEQGIDGAPVAAPRLNSVLGGELERLERELLGSEAELRRAMADLETTNEELQASTEELQASSEELQAANEALESANEELAATNDELGSVVAGQKSREHELTRLNADLENIQASINQGMILVDADLCITRYTPLATRVFALAAEDIGRPLLSVSMTMSAPGLADALHAVAGGGPRRSLEATGGPMSFLLQVLPYQANGQRRGAILTLTDISDLVAQRAATQAALAELEHITDALTEVVWKRVANTSELTFVSARIADLIGISAAEVVADPAILDEVIDPDDRAAVARARLSAKSGWNVRFRVLPRNGPARWVREQAQHVDSPDGRFVVGTWMDIGDRVAAEQTTADQATVLASVFDTEVFGVAILDPRDRVIRANDTLCAMLGRDQDYVVGTPFDSFWEPEPNAPHLNDLIVGAGGVVSVQRLRTADGTPAWGAVSVRPLSRIVGEAAAIAIARDITALRQGIESLERRSRFDSATGVAGRDAFADEVERELARADRVGESVALLSLVLDGFDEADVQHDPQAGDQVRRVVAHRLEAAVPERGLVGRTGEDEFSVLIPAVTDVGDLDVVVERIQAAVAEPVPDESGQQSQLSASIGVAVHPEDGDRARSLMRAAALGVHAAQVGSGTTARFVRPNMSAAADQRRALRHSLARAIEDRAFQLHYQPVVDPRDGAVHGVAALCRWIRGDAVLDADDFLPLGETGQIQAVGLLTLDLLRRDREELRAAGYGSLPVSVHLSLTQIADPRHLETLRTWPQPPGLAGLEVGVPESVLLPTNSRCAETVSQLTAMGASLGLDGFGSGLSHLATLRTLAPDLVRVNPALLAEADDPAGRSELTGLAIRLAHCLGAVVVVDGVENHAQQAQAIELGADLAQGSHLARPMPIAELIGWMGDRGEGPAGRG